jgi:glyoxylase-like metal-dependent hydrolase (beta-lactamase superfamily II)
MNNWKITALRCGQMTLPPSVFGGLDSDRTLDIPLTVFLLRNGEENVLVDTGMKEEYFEQMAIGDVNPMGSTEDLLGELKKEGLEPKDIDTVIYTHLHYDHVGNAFLFPDAVTYVQKSEYNNLMNPYPFQQARQDYFDDTLVQIKTIKRLILVDGDLKLANGLELYWNSGHSLGGQSIVVPTAKGRYVLTGDNPSAKYSLFPWLDKITLMDGSEFEITPLTDGSVPFLTGVFTTDQFAAYDAHYKQLALAQRPEPEFLLTSHDPSNIYIRNFG